MRHTVRAVVCFFLLACLPTATYSGSAAEASPLTVRLSVTQAGLEANGGSSNPYMSADGRYVTFTSSASNLVEGDSTYSDTFVYDRQTGQLKRVPDISGATITADGRYLAFSSSRTDLVTDDTNGFDDVFLMEWQTGQSTRVSLDSSGGQGNARSWGPSVSSDGRYVAFLSEATNLAPLSVSGADISASGTGLWRIYIRDRTTGQTTLASRNNEGKSANRDSYHPTISGDGRYVSFTSEADNMPGAGSILYSDVPNVYLHDRIGGTTLLVSRKPSGYRSDNLLASSWNGAISADGRYVAFGSEAHDLVSGDMNGMADAFVFDRTTLGVSLVSLGAGGVAANNSSGPLAISDDGKQVLFRSYATNLVTGDGNSVQDLFVRDVAAGQTTRVSVGSDGREGNKVAQGGALSADGRYVAFYSSADNLVPCDTNGREDVFLHDRQGTAQPWPSVKSLALTVPTGPLPADGTTKADVAVLVTDTQGRPMGCAAVNLSLNPSLGRLSATSVTTSLDGRATVQYTVPWSNDLGSHTSVTITATSGSASQSGTVSFATSCVKVQNESGQPVAGAEVWRNGGLAGSTGSDGRLCTLINAGDALVARQQVHQQTAVKGSHDGWAYRAYVTSLDVPTTGEPLPMTVTDPAQEQLLTLRTNNALIGFNIVASVEWDAHPDYLAELTLAFLEASLYLYDATDGQMLFERVTIYDNGQHFGDADYQFRASNQEWPRAHVRGLFGGSLLHVMLGRYFSGSDSNSGPWMLSNGYRTMIHEFGHYGLGLYDSYVNYWIESLRIWKRQGSCTGPEIITNGASATNATLMDRQSVASEFAALGVPGLWNQANCTMTSQWRRHSESDWQTMSRYFGGSAFRLRTPIERKALVAGPTTLTVPAWSGTPTVVGANTGICAANPVVSMTLWPWSSAASGVSVYLKRSDGTVIDQGKTSPLGSITVLGAGNGDTVHGYAWQENGLRIQSQTISCAVSAASVPQGPAPIAAVDSRALEPAAFSVGTSVSAGGSPGLVSVRVTASAALAGAPAVRLHQTGGAAVSASLALDGPGTYSGTAALDAGLPLAGTIEVTASDTTAHVIEYFASFALQTVDAGDETIVWSADGLAEVYLPVGALPAGTSVGIGVVAMPPPPADLVVVSGPYEVSAGAALATGANVSLGLPGGGPAAYADLSTTRVWRLDGGAWSALDSTVDVTHRYAAAPISSLGTYAALAEVQWRAFVPMAFR